MLELQSSQCSEGWLFPEEIKHIPTHNVQCVNPKDRKGRPRGCSWAPDRMDRAG